MKSFIEGLLIVIGTILLIGSVAVFSGTILYWIWPIAIPATFPGLVENGTISAELTWWGAVCFTWLCGILIKSTQTNNQKS